MQQNIKKMTQKETLDDLREQIDSIDDKIIQLLLDRVEIVKEVGERKNQSSVTPSFIRAGREAAMVRNLVNKAKGVYEPEAITTIWRMIISSSLQMEQDMPIAAFSIEQDKQCLWLAREYFGAFSDLSTCPTTSQIIREVISGKVAVGVLPMPLSEADDQWWVAMAHNEKRPAVFAVLPFVESTHEKAALAIADVQPERTGDDITLLTIEVDDMVSKDRVVKTFADLGVEARVKALVNKPQIQGARYLLVEVDTFLQENSGELQRFIDAIGKKSVKATVLGSYASPIQK